MACTFTQNIGLECKDGIGGIKQIWVGDYATNLPYVSVLNGTATVDTDNYDGIIVELPPQTGSFEETINFNRDNGTVFYTQTINIMLHKLSLTKRNELSAVAQSRVMVIVTDNNGNDWLCGYEMPLDLSTATASTGKALGDLNGYTLAFVGESPNRAYSTSI